MMSTLDQNPLPDAVIDQAANWLARLSADEVAPEECEEFQAWLDQGLSHRLAFESVQSLSGQLDSLAATAGDRTLPPQLATAVSECEQLAKRAHTGGSSASRVWSAAASLIIVLCGALLWQNGWQNGAEADPALYRTIVGQQRAVMLPDGSMMTLNTNTDVAVAITESDRRIYLKSGEAYFDVAKDPQRPFTIAVATAPSAPWAPHSTFVTVKNR